MAFSLSRMSWWLFGSKEKVPPSNGEIDILNLPSQSWNIGEERKHDKQNMLVQSDGGIYLSGSESNGPDWSIGWVEPHGQNFCSHEEEDDGFAVLVPCYRSGGKELGKGSTANNHILSAIKNLPSEFANEGKNYMEWVSSLQNC